MPHEMSRRRFLQTSTAFAAVAAAAGPHAMAAEPRSIGSLVLNDDGYVFLVSNDALSKDDLRRYLQSYCREGVSTVAYCVGDMSWPTLYPSKVGVPYTFEGVDDRRKRIYRNVENFASEPGGYFGTVFSFLREFGKTTLASFRMNDAHFTTPDDPNVSKFWKEHRDLALRPNYGYYGGCLNYESELVREHLLARVTEFAELYPEIDGIELDALRSPFFFPPDKGKENAPLFTELVREIKAALAAQAKRLNRPDYLLTVNVPRTPELALECGLDTATWDTDQFFDCMSAGTYQAYMQVPVERWKQHLKHGTPVLTYLGVSPQTGQYLGRNEYRAAAANAYGGGADGVYVFNYPCLYELAMQVPGPVDEVDMTLPDMRSYGHPDLSIVGQALNEMHQASSLKGKDTHYLFHFSKDDRYRHYSPVLEPLERPANDGILKATFRCYEDYEDAHAITLRFKVENVARGERFKVILNGKRIAPEAQKVRFAANGRDTRIHTVKLGPYMLYEIALQPDQLKKGENALEVSPTRLNATLEWPIHLTEIELLVQYA